MDLDVDVDVGPLSLHLPLNICWPFEQTLGFFIEQFRGVSGAVR